MADARGDGAVGAPMAAVHVILLLSVAQPPPDPPGTLLDRPSQNEKMIQLIEEKDPAYPQESQLRALLSDGASPSYLGEYKCA